MHDAGCPTPKGLVSEILHHIGAKNRVHPVREYLDGLEWDGKKRLHGLVPYYLRAQDSPLNRAMGKAWMIAAVRRVRQPGVKFDYILTLQGEQGSGKSTFFRILAGDDWFNDSLEIGVSAKEVIENASGSWIIELAELSSMSRREVEEVKKFASIQADRARTAWARVAEMVPRQFVFGATVNRAEFLIDDTGNRRFWVAAVGRTREAELRSDRDQLWAEAAHCEAQNESHNIRDELWEEVTRVNEKHLVHDPVADAAESILSALPEEDAVVSAHQLACACGIDDVTRQGGAIARSIAAGARRAGWAADRGRLPGPRTPGSVRYFHSRRTGGPLTVFECAHGGSNLTEAYVEEFL
jgi:predicted P-loop ATPase